MPEIRLTSKGIADELARLQESWGAGIEALRGAEPVAIGATPRECLWQTGKARLYRYLPPAENSDADKAPLLLVYALVNRPDMVDLQPGRSLVADLLAQGFDVYLLDWGFPDPLDRTLGLENYLLGYLDSVVDFLRDRLSKDALTLFGICQGGTLSACYGALYPSKVNRLVLTVTPIDFHTPDDMLSHLAREIDFDALSDACGNIDGRILNAAFLSLKPYRLLQQKYLRFLESAADPAERELFLRMEKWIFDSPALPARISRQFARHCYQENALVNDALSIGSHRVDLRQLSMPVLNIYARDDHLVPPAASRALVRFIPPERYNEHEIPGGHIGIYVGSRAGVGVVDVVAAWWRAQGKTSGGGLS